MVGPAPGWCRYVRRIPPHLCRRSCRTGPRHCRILRASLQHPAAAPRSARPVQEPLIVATEVVGGIFLVVEGLAVFAAVAITRTMTGTVARLTEATAHVQAGDFSHRVPVVRRDQLGALAEA